MDELINNTNDDLALGYGDKLADVCRAYVELMTDIRELLKEVEEDKKEHPYTGWVAEKMQEIVNKYSGVK
jgi:hypothetical protein